jgi:hypothetical protein
VEGGSLKTMDAYDHLLDHDALYCFDLAFQLEIGERETSDTIHEFVNPDSALWNRLKQAEEQFRSPRGDE